MPSPAPRQCQAVDGGRWPVERGAPVDGGPAAERPQHATPTPGALAGSWTPLTLQNGWTNSPFGTSAAAVRMISGIVQLKGTIATTGSNPVPFTLPAGFRPAGTVFAQVARCTASNGRLQIEPTGGGDRRGRGRGVQQRRVLYLARRGLLRDVTPPWAKAVLGRAARWLQSCSPCAREAPA